MPPEPPANPYLSLPAFDEATGDLNGIVDTPKHSRNKYEYDGKLGLFKLGGVLPAGAYFPYDFGYVPSTLGEDGDPLDVLILMDEPAFVGCLVPARLIGVIEAEQTERDGETTRNDRLIGAAADSRLLGRVRTLESLGPELLEEIEHFFVSYNDIKGKVFKPLGRFGPQKALKVVEEGAKLYRQSKRKRAPSKSGKAKKRG